MKIQKLENASKVLKAIQDENIKLVGISPEDLVILNI